MNTRSHSALVLGLALLAALSVVGVTGALSGSDNAPLWQAQDAALAPDGSPAVVAYQGEVHVADAPLTGDGYFKFAAVNAAGNFSYWSNDGTSTGGGEPTAAVGLAVSEGLFGVLLGDMTLDGMTVPLTADVFSYHERYLRVWFSTDAGGPFEQLTPDTRVAAVPYALQAQQAVYADVVDGLHASDLKTHYQNVVVVAKSGGDHTSVQAAIDGITDAAIDAPYLVWVAPGVYQEQVTMKPYVHLQGAGQEATIIASGASSGWLPTQGTVVMASDTSLRDLTVGNSGSGERNVAILATAGVTRTLAAHVTARASGDGAYNYAVFLTGNGTGVTLQDVTALAENGSDSNYGLISFSSKLAIVRGGSYTGRGGTYTRGIYNAGGGTALIAEDATALAENGSAGNYGLTNYMGVATLRGGTFTGRGGTDARGISSRGSGATLDLQGVAALAEDGSEGSCGLRNGEGATATARGGTFSGDGGINSWGIFNADSGATLQTESVAALGENGSNSTYGLQNADSAVATLHGGTCTGRGGIYAHGVRNNGTGSTLVAEGLTALGEGGFTYNFGLRADIDTAATVRGGAYTGRGGSYARGIQSGGTGTILEAERITALGENGSESNSGLHHVSNAVAILRGCSFTGYGGTEAVGIYNSSGTTVEAEDVTALGTTGAQLTYGLENREAAAAALHGGSFAARGGISAKGILNGGAGATVEAFNITAVGENASSTNYGLFNAQTNTGSGTANVSQSVLEGAFFSVYRYSGTVTVSNSRLMGGGVSGAVICVAVSRGIAFNPIGCP